MEDPLRGREEYCYALALHFTKLGEKVGVGMSMDISPFFLFCTLFGFGIV